MIEEKREGGGIDGVFCHPERMQIILALRRGTMYTSELSRKLGVERSLLTYHLQILKKGGYLTDRFEISDNGNTKGRALHRFVVTKKAKEQIDTLAEVLRNV